MGKTLLKSKRRQWEYLSSVHRPDISLAFFSEWIRGLGQPGPWHPSSVLSAEVDPTLYQTAGEFLPEYWAVESVSKYPFVLPGVDREAKAILAFDEAEDRCRAANAHLCDALAKPFPEKYRRIIRQARQKLSWLLSGISRDEVMQRAGWGPGASTSLPRKRASHQIKWEFATHVTIGALPWYVALCRYARVPNTTVNVVHENRVTTVPKNAKTDRVIAIEPDWNMFFQLGLGRSIRRRLNRVGLLLETAQERNKALASCGSRDGSFATIDLKGASDSVSLAICELLLPRNVFTMMTELRSECGRVGDKSVTYEKISSMGNGFTFELETALFWAISSSVAGDAAVFGDDIIVPNEHASELIEVIRFFGFEVNEKKTHYRGPFRESCGGHFFNGIDVTPPYFKKPLASLPVFMSGANAIRLRSKGWPCLANDLDGAWNLLAKTVPRFLWGPESVGDIVLHRDRKDLRPKRDGDLQCYSGKGLVSIRKYAEAPVLGAYTASLHGASCTELFPTPGETYIIRKWYTDKL